MLAAKHFDIVLGIDIHLVMPPGAPPVPIPHPFIGMVFDPMDYIPKIGATVHVNGLPRAQAGSSGRDLPVHIPIGGTFVKPINNDCEMFMGSSTVLADGSPLSYMSLPALSCQCIGMITPPRKKGKKKPGFYLPTSIVLPIPTGKTVLVGGAPTIDMTAMAFKAGLAGLGKLKKGKFTKKVSDKIHDAAAKMMNKLGIPPSVRNLVHKAICTVTGHPVDVATGKVFTDHVDFELPGPIPLKWERTWYSTSQYKGPLGHGWHHSYDMALAIDKEGKAVVLRMEDGRTVTFPALSEEDNSYYHRQEKLTLFKTKKGYGVKDAKQLIYRFQPTEKDPELAQLTRIQNAGGHSIQFAYTGNGYLQSITDSAGRLLHITCDEKGRITSIRTVNPGRAGNDVHLIRYRYDSTGNMIEAKDALDHSFTFGYKEHLMVRETNRNGLSFYFEYIGNNHDAYCIRTWGDGGIYDHKLTYEPGLTIVENSLGHKTHYWHDGGLVNRVRDAKGNESSTLYNEYNELLMEINPLGQTTSYAYDERGNPASVIQPDGAKIAITYENDLPILATDAGNGIWQWGYNGQAQLTSKINPAGISTLYEYQSGLLHAVTTPAGRTELNYDGEFNLRQLILPDKTESRWRYNAWGGCIASIDPKGNIQHRSFDYLSRVVEVQEPDSNLRLLAYDPEGNVIKAKDKKHDVSFEYSGMGRMTARIENDTRVEFKYDTEEQLTAIKNEHGMVYSFKLDPLGDVVEEAGFDRLTHKYRRDAGGKVLVVERTAGSRSFYEYDDAGRVIAIKHSDGTAERFAYNQKGELIEAENKFSKVLFERDPLGQVLKEIQGPYEILSQYNKQGLRIAVQSSLGANIHFERNGMGDVEKVTAGNGLSSWETSIKRDLTGLEIERSLPGGIRSKWERDNLGRPLQHEVLGSKRTYRSKRYVWDVNDRLKQIIDEQKGTTTRFEHDDFGNLAMAKYEDGSVEYRMPDAVGNLFRTKEQKDRKYGPAGQLLEANGTRYQYDALGNLICKFEKGGRIWKYEWYASGMLKKVIRPDGDAVSFTYDALGRRLSKTYKNKTTHWVWDGNTPLHEWVEEMKEGNSLRSLEELKADVPKQEGNLATPIHGPPDVAKLITWIFEADSFVPMAKLAGGQEYSIITDHLGTPVQMFNGNGMRIWEMDLGIYGQVRSIEGEREDCPFRYQGQYEDVETGLYYNRFRYYDAEGGLYLSHDPIGLLGGIRPYGYVDDPNMWIDPWGLAKTYCNNSQRWRDTNTGRYTSVPIDPAEMVRNGRLNHNDVTQWANHHGLTNNWSPSGNFPTGGFNYTLNHSSGNYKIHGHGINPNAVANFPGSNSATGPTASIKNLNTNQNFRTNQTWGTFGSDPNGAHIPLDGSPY